MSTKKKSFLVKLFTGATPEQSRDTGLAAVLLCLLLTYFWNYQQLISLAILVLLVTMIWPGLFRPLAGLWFGLAHLMGAVVSRVVLAILFFGVVTPIGLFRRLLGADPLQLKKWKRGSESVFVRRSALILPADLEKPY
jgi:Mg2+/citrate symporter